MKKAGSVQPKDDAGMRQRNERDKEVLLNELAPPQNRRIFIDEPIQDEEMNEEEKDQGMKKGGKDLEMKEEAKHQEMPPKFSQIAT